MKLLRKNFFVLLIFAVILALAFFLRVYNLGSVPNGLHIDEASLGYNGYSLLLTGKDENNHALPLYINMFGDDRPSGYHYLTIIPVALFGLTEFSTRLPGALFGVLSVIPFFFLAELLFKNRKISLISSLIFAVAPWQVVLSRASNETIVALFLILVGYVLFLFGLQAKKLMYLFIGAIILSLSFFFYHTPRVFVPLLVLVTIAYLYPLWKKLSRNLKISVVASFLLLSFISFSLVFLARGGTGRFSQVNIFSDPHTGLVMAEQIREDGDVHMPTFITRAFHNKLINYSLGYITNYLDYFSGRFLFLEGGLPNWYKVPAMGVIYLVELPFILLGIFYLLSSKDKYHKLPLLWLLLAPVTAAFTTDDVPNVNRVIVMFPMIELIAAYGLVVFAEKFSDIKLKVIYAVVFFLFLANFAYFLHQYFVHSTIHQNWYRYEGFNKMMAIVKEDYSSYKQVVISKSFGGIYPLVLFYMRYNPAVYQKEGSPKDKADGGFGKFRFASSECPSFNLDPKIPLLKHTLFIDNGTCKDYKGLKYLQHTYIYRKDGTKAFRIVYE